MLRGSSVAEHLTHNQRVDGSTPSPATNLRDAKILRCEECGKIMTKLPTTATCLNTACRKAGQLIPRRTYGPATNVTEAPTFWAGYWEHQEFLAQMWRNRIPCAIPQCRRDCNHE